MLWYRAQTVYRSTGLRHGSAMGKLFNLLVSQLTIRVVQELNQMINIKCLEGCLVHCKC